MQKYLIDTTVLIDHLRGMAWATAFLEQEGLLVSVVSVTELIQGARNKKEQRAINELLDQFEINWGSNKINRLAVKLQNEYFLKYNLKFMDSLMAATALSFKLTLVTDNLKDFGFIKGLKVMKPKHKK